MGDEFLTPKLAKVSKKASKKPRKLNQAEILRENEDVIIAETVVNYGSTKNVINSPALSSSPKSVSFIQNIINAKMARPKNANQRLFVDYLKDPLRKVVISTGPAGTGKTMFACQHGVESFFHGSGGQGQIQKLIFTRPIVSVDSEDIGFLPGGICEKFAPWVRPIYDVLEQFASVKEIERLIEEKYIEIVPLGFMRGRTFKNSWIVADEMQNSSISQIKMLLTRIGENSKMVITGDLQQCDRPAKFYGGGKWAIEKNGLEDFIDKFKQFPLDTFPSICHVEFQQGDVLREAVVSHVLDIYGCISPGSSP
jgi:phosphate starvation-inducible PhoH-like protein